MVLIKAVSRSWARQRALVALTDRRLCLTRLDEMIMRIGSCSCQAIY